MAGLVRSSVNGQSRVPNPAASMTAFIIRSQKSEVRSQKSEVRSQNKSGGARAPTSLFILSSGFGLLISKKLNFRAARRAPGNVSPVAPGSFRESNLRQ